MKGSSISVLLSLFLPILYHFPDRFLPSLQVLVILQSQNLLSREYWHIHSLVLTPFPICSFFDNMYTNFVGPSLPETVGATVWIPVPRGLVELFVAKNATVDFLYYFSFEHVFWFVKLYSVHISMIFSWPIRLKLTKQTIREPILIPPRRSFYQFPFSNKGV